MTKRIIKRNMTKRKKYIKKRSKSIFKKNISKRNKYGGDRNPAIQEEQQAKNLFRRTLNNLIIQIKNKKNIRQAINSLVRLFDNTSESRKMINTLIPVDSFGNPIDKETYSEAKKPKTIYDFVSPITVIFDNLTGVISNEDIIKILNAYYSNGGNFNNLSSRLKQTPFKHELNKNRIDNLKILLNSSNKFHIIEDGLDEETKQKLAELIPTEQKITMSIPEEMPSDITSNKNIEEEMVTEEVVSKEVKLKDIPLQLPYVLPENNEVGYDRNNAPEFWKPIFENGDKLLEIRNNFMELFYKFDRYTDDNQKRIKICDLLETIIPGYLTKYTLDYREIPKTLINVNILNCFITLLYGIILYKLYETKQEYLFIFKGGRALQLSLVDIPEIGKYFSEDTDILIIPNPTENQVYDLEKMENLSAHIAYLVKWFIPQEINIIVSLPTNPKNQNKDITKLIYNDGKIFKALSDIGFGKIPEDIQKYFENFLYFPFYIKDFDITSLFITPELDDMLSEKLFYYSKYLTLKTMLENNQPIIEKKYSGLTIEEAERILFKFKRAIIKLVDAIVKKNYTGAEDFNKIDASKYVLRSIIGNFEDYTLVEREKIISEILTSIY